MSNIWKEAFEVVGDGVPVVTAFYEKRRAESAALWEAVKGFGASGYRPSYNGGIRSLYFPELPKHYRQIGVGDERLLECVPRKNSTAGRALADAIAAVPVVTPESDILYEFGWSGDRPTDGYRVFHATMARVQLPALRYLACFPRQLDDGFAPPATLRAIPMSEYLRAFEDHNAAVAAKKALAA